MAEEDPKDSDIEISTKDSEEFEETSTETVEDDESHAEPSTDEERLSSDKARGVAEAESNQEEASKDGDDQIEGDDKQKLSDELPTAFLEFTGFTTSDLPDIDRLTVRNDEISANFEKVEQDIYRLMVDRVPTKLEGVIAAIIAALRMKGIMIMDRSEPANLEGPERKIGEPEGEEEERSSSNENQYDADKMSVDNPEKEENIKLFELGIRLCRLLVKFMVMLSPCEKELAKLKNLRPQLASHIGFVNSSAVIRKFIDLLEKMDSKLNKLNVSSRDARGVNDGCVIIKASLFEEKQADILMSDFFGKIVQLQWVADQSSLEIKSRNAVIIFMHLRLAELERKIKDIQDRRNDLMIMSNAPSFWTVNMHESFDRREMERVIDKLWRDMKEKEDSKGEN